MIAAAAADKELHSELDLIGPTVERHPLDCQCVTCSRFLEIMDELARRDKHQRGDVRGFHQSLKRERSLRKG